MSGKRLYRILSALFLFLLIGTKGLGYHSITHDDSEGAVQCELCTFVMQQEGNDYTPPVDLDLPVPNIPAIDKQKDIKGIVVFDGRFSPDALFSRPPPAWA